MEVRRKRHGIFQEPHEKICQSNILYAVKRSFRKKRSKVNIIKKKNKPPKLKEDVTKQPTLMEWAKEII